MKRVMVIPIDVFNALVEKCSASRPEYQTLKNGFVMRTEGGGEEVHIRCNSDVAETILVLADQLCAEALRHIREVSLPD